jgi:hypothetical protein
VYAGSETIGTSQRSAAEQSDRQRFDPLTYTMIDRDQDTTGLPVQLYDAASCESYDSGRTIYDRWTSCLDLDFRKGGR